MAGPSWIGGDIPGLAQMGTSPSAAPADMRGVVTALSGQVDGLVSAAGWQGDAAENFRKKWGTDAVTAGGLAEVVGQVGAVLGDLAGKLRQVESALHDAAAEAAKQGVPIGPDGRLGPMMTAQPPTAQGAAATQAAQTYSQEYSSALQLAQGFRLAAADNLSSLYDQIGPDHESPTSPDQWVTIGDYLSGLYTVPNDKNAEILQGGDAKLKAAQDAMSKARKDLKAAKAAYQAKGLKLPSDADAKLTHSQALTELDDLKTELSSAEAGKGELPLSKLLDTKLSDVADLSALSKLGGVGDAIKDIPVLDIAAAGAAATLQYQDDVNKGWSPTHAAVADYGSAALGLGAAAGTAALASGPPGWIAAGAGLVGVGVGDFAYQAFQEDWGQDIAEHGVVDGVGTGIAHVGENTGKDIAHMAEGIGEGAKDLGVSAWHGLENAGSAIGGVASKVWDSIF